MQDLQTGEMVELSRKQMDDMTGFRTKLGSDMGQVDFEDAPLPSGRQGPIFKLGDTFAIMATPKGGAESKFPMGVPIEFVIQAIHRKGLVIRLTKSGHVDLRSILIRTQIIEIRGGKFKVDSIGHTGAVLVGLPGQLGKARH